MVGFDIVFFAGFFEGALTMLLLLFDVELVETVLLVRVLIMVRVDVGMIVLLDIVDLIYLIFMIFVGQIVVLC